MDDDLILIGSIEVNLDKKMWYLSFELKMVDLNILCCCMWPDAYQKGKEMFATKTKYTHLIYVNHFIWMTIWSSIDINVYI